MRLGDFLLKRLADIGTTRIFGVPGDYNLSFLEQVEAHASIEWVGTCNELNGAYAADGYARTGKPGVLLTTYGVGCLSAINGVAGAYCEHVPLIHISGAPPSHAVRDRAPLHHSLLDGGYRNIHRAFTEFTEYTARLSPENAADVIDHALRVAFRSRRPVRLELPSDLTHVEIRTPDDVLTIEYPAAAGPPVDDAAGAVARALAGSRRPLLLFDLPAVRWGAVEAIEQFCVALDIPYFCTLPAVHQGNPEHLQYLGVLPGKEADRQAIFEAADLVLACGFIQSDVTTGCFSLDLDSKQVVELQTGYTQLGGPSWTESAVYYGTGIAEVLTAALPKVSEEFGARQRWWSAPAAPVVAAPSDSGGLDEEFFFARLGAFLRPDDVLIAETGTSAQNLAGLPLPTGVRYINQTSWGSIGYALPALLGSLMSTPERRHVLCIGDGSFQLTAQELSTIIRHGFAPVIFLLNNRGYTIERSILGARASYNDVANWSYHELPRVFGIDESRLLTRVCATRAELDAAMREAADTACLSFIEVALAPLDMTSATTNVGTATRVYDYGVYGPPNPLRK
ncbi:MAG: alpha-keto acid decarboxylase family protein [Mycolicibacterium sp.]|uniref:alpha-keto acid decarboxylase family protein n=1 Tax=Mycolicibacterium sp. TaxID=2320850 RepID=UPI003D0C4B92